MAVIQLGTPIVAKRTLFSLTQAVISPAGGTGYLTEAMNTERPYLVHAYWNQDSGLLGTDYIWKLGTDFELAPQGA